MEKVKSEFLKVSSILRSAGITLHHKLSTGEFRVNFTNGKEETACYEVSLPDAKDTGLAMAEFAKNQIEYKGFTLSVNPRDNGFYHYSQLGSGFIKVWGKLAPMDLLDNGKEWVDSLIADMKS